MTYYCEKIVPGFLNMVKEFEGGKDLSFPEDPIELNEGVRNLIDELKGSDDEAYFFLSYQWHFSEIIRSDKENLTKALELYYTRANEYYKYHEYYSSSVQLGNSHFYLFDPYLLYLCGKYYDSIEDSESAELASYVSLLPLSDYYDSIPQQFEKNFKLLFKYGCADWLCEVPRLSCFIGEYYLSKEKYGNAYKYFKFGAELDYDGRQTNYPFHCVGRNQYRLGEMYYKGLGRNKNTRKALQWFSLAAENFAREALPVMGDIYYEGDGVKKNHEKALFCYSQQNKYYDYDEEYFYLNEEQEKRCLSLLNDYYDGSLSFEDKLSVYNTYKDVLGINDKADDIHTQIIKDIASIPVDKRTMEMDEVYVGQRLKDIKEELTVPIKPTGSIPKSLKVNDTFTFGQFLGEPIEWKVLNIDEDNKTAFIITTKILAKMTYSAIAEWLNEDFLNHAFTESQKDKIVLYEDAAFLRDKKFGVYLPAPSQYEEYEGVYPVGTIEETEFAKGLCNTKQVWALGHHIMNEDGKQSRIISYGGIYGIRPAMDVYYQ